MLSYDSKHIYSKTLLLVRLFYECLILCLFVYCVQFGDQNLLICYGTEYGDDGKIAKYVRGLLILDFA